LFDHGDIGPTSLVGYCKAILYLQLVCRFSQPCAYLFPDIGATELFDGKHHRQVYLFDTNDNNNEEDGGVREETKVQEGEPVQVLFPGLYFVNPENGSSEKPMVRAVVAQCYNANKNRTESFEL
jgi:hypothetical protein